MLTVKIETGNAAFQQNPESEAARIIAELADHLNSLHGRGIREDEGALFDANGNKVGSYQLTDDSDE